MAARSNASMASGRRERVFTILLLLLAAGATIARVVLAYKTPISPNTDADLDDMMLMNYANYLRAGEWVGPYGVHTLAKNVGYSLCMAAFRMLGMRYQLGFALLLVLVCLLSAQALRPLVPSLAVRCSLYVVLLYLPVFLSSYFFQRVYRNGMAVVFALLVFSTFVGVYLRRRERLGVLCAWALLAGASLGFFSIIQESAAWALPFAVASMLVTMVLVLVDAVRLRAKVLERQRRRASAKAPRMRFSVARVAVPRLVILAVPLVVCVGVTSGVRAINQAHYGVALLNDKYQGEFARATADLMRIDAGFADDRVWVCNDALDQALAASPALRSMKKEINKYWKICQDISAGFNVLDPAAEPQVVGDHSYWALRSAYFEHGGYADAQQTERYWGAVANELEQAFEEGTLKRKDGLYLSATTQPLPWDRVAGWVASSAEVVGRYAWGDLVEETLIRPLPYTEVGTGQLDAQLEARDLLGQNTLFKVDGELYEDRASQVAQPWLQVDNALGKTLVLVQRILLVASAIGLVVLLVRDIRGRSVDGLRTGLILVGLALSAFVLVFGASWMISFLSSNESAVAASSNAFSYCGAVYAL
ncbi:MAG: hypothetical protein Q4A07_09955, partial [Coriobacteriales bacterium]|nr:hypothetical protein [Coriobacteriales bacterium]